MTSVMAPASPGNRVAAADPQSDVKEGLGQAPLPTVSVIIAAYSMDRWDGLCRAVQSVADQTVPALETVVVSDHNPQLLERARRELPGAKVLPNTGHKGASGARNTGVAAAQGDVVAFLDDDVVAAPGWLEALLTHFADPVVAGVGGFLFPLWKESSPRWFPPEFGWVVGVSYRGMPESAAQVRNVWTANMAISRVAFHSVGGFRDGFGKIDSRPEPEDTDFCLRVAAAHNGKVWIYEPNAQAGHCVPPNRATVRFFLYRCFNEGLGKAELSKLNGARLSTSSERRYASSTLTRGFMLAMKDLVQGDLPGAARALAIAAGLSCAAAGFVLGRSRILIWGLMGWRRGRASAGGAGAVVLTRSERAACSQAADYEQVQC